MTGKNWSAVSIALLLLLLLSSLLPIAHVGKVSAATRVVPPGILYYAPITLTNSQNSLTPTPFQQMVQVDSSTYSAYEASNLQNIEFFDSSGNTIPSWLESGDSNSSINSIYWLNLANGILADSSLTVYMGFAAPSRNLLNLQTTGEAPELSTIYGAYDDGSKVFNSYWGFENIPAPTGLELQSGWYSDNGLYLNIAGVTYTEAVFSLPQAYPFVFDTFMSAMGNDNMGWNSNAWAFDTAPDNYAAGTRVGGEGYWSGTPTTSPPTPSPAVFGFVETPDATSTYWYNGAFSTVSPQGGNPSNFDDPSTNNYNTNAIFAATGTGMSATFDWARVRAYPPNGVMPTVSFGTVTSSESVSVNCSPSLVTLGSATICGATVTGSSPTGIVIWSSSGSGSFSSASCTLSSGSCQVSYTPSDASLSQY